MLRKRFERVFGRSIIALGLGVILFFSCDDNSSKSDNEKFEDVKTSIVIDDPDILDNLEIVAYNWDQQVIQLRKDSSVGVAEEYFFGKTAKYDITIYYFNEDIGESEITLLINGDKKGSVLIDNQNNDKGLSYKHKNIPAVDIQCYSKIALKFSGDHGGRCRIEKIVLTPVGEFGGTEVFLSKPNTLEIYEKPEEKLRRRKMLSDFVRSHRDSVMNRRLKELSKLKSPAEWKARQEKTRKDLVSFFGNFPKKTPLNVKIVGKIERKRYTIEKIIYESQPQYFVAANLYIPKNRIFPLPGVLVTSGHEEDGRGFSEYTEFCIGLVLKGYIVMASDAVGQNERSEYVDSDTKNSLVKKGVSQHIYIGKPSFLLNWTLSGLRVWDCIRAVDYLASRIEVDTNKLAAAGNSGGGQMAMLTTALDNRIKVCVAGHPGGNMENIYLSGQTLIDRKVMSLIPPRPFRIIVGESSGEESYHRAKLTDMRLFYDGLGYTKQRSEFLLVKGVHNLKKPKREAMYEWINKWFDKEEEGKSESLHHSENPSYLRASNSGSTIISFGGETAQTLNTKRLKQIFKTDENGEALKDRIATRIKLEIPEERSKPPSHTSETIFYDNLSIEKLTYESETGIVIPSLLIKSKYVPAKDLPIVIYASDKGKPKRYLNTIIPFQLANNGFIVFAVDVRGTGETNPTGTLPAMDEYAKYFLPQWRCDALSLRNMEYGRTMAGMRTLDMIRAVDYIKSRDDLKAEKIVVIGQGLGGLWASLATIFDFRVSGLVTIGTLPSYKLIVTSHYYNVNPGYFWLPGALLDFDIPDLMHLISPKPNIWIDPINALGEKLDSVSASSMIKPYKNLQIITSDKNPAKNISNIMEEFQ